MSNPTRAGMAPPLPREWLDNIAPGVRALFGVLFIVWSWASTIIIIGWLLEPVMHNTAITGVVTDRFLIGVLISFLVSVAEFVSSDRWPRAHWIVVLVADASFTTWQTHTWLSYIIAARTSISTFGDILIWIVSIVGGIVAAKFGEILLFGRQS